MKINNKSDSPTITEEPFIFLLKGQLHEQWDGLIHSGIGNVYMFYILYLGLNTFYLSNFKDI